LKDIDWIDLYAFGVTGRRLTPEQLRLMHGFWTYTSYPDARLWNNRVAALAGSVRSSVYLGLAGALAISEASIFGGGVFARCLDFFIDTRRRVEAGDDLNDCLRDELDAHRSIGGYGRPIHNGDERNQHLLALAASLGLDQGPYLRLAFAVEDALLAGRWRMKMNYAALVAALGLDVGFTKSEFCVVMFPTFLAGMPPGFVEAKERPEGALFSLSCRDISYEGKSRRPWRSVSNVNGQV
jgi:hypothetical protein